MEGTYSTDLDRFHPGWMNRHWPIFCVLRWLHVSRNYVCHCTLNSTATNINILSIPEWPFSWHLSIFLLSKPIKLGKFLLRCILTLLHGFLGVWMIYINNNHFPWFDVGLMNLVCNKLKHQYSPDPMLQSEYATNERTQIYHIVVSRQIVTFYMVCKK